MTELDKMIREALAEEDAKLLDAVGGELTLLQKGLDLFKTNTAWLVGVVLVVQFTFLGLMIFSAISFFQSVETKDLIMWSVVFMFSNLAVAMLKIWSLMEINRNSVTREITRLELQVAYMSRRLLPEDSRE